MKKKFKLGVIGAGFMSTAIIQGVIRSGIVKNSEIIVSDVSEDALNRMKNNCVSVTLDNTTVCNNSEFVLFAVKPQSFSSVALGIKECECTKYISIMAGLKKDKIKACFSKEIKVARCMPNTPCSISSGAVGIDISDFTDSNDVDFVKSVFSSLASVSFVDESLLGAVTGVSGSSPAYFYLFLKGIVEAGVKFGLTEEDSLKLATNTMIGAGKMVLNNPDKSIDDLINAVCSKGGTTIEAVNHYKESGLSEITYNAIEKCIKRSEELEKL